jgi:two-component system cell cycle sensor histidine kinase/response regulator CckA
MYVPRTMAWDRLDSDSRARLLEGALRDVARRSLAGAMVYFATLALLPLASTVLRDHRSLTIFALLGTFAAGAARCFVASKLLRGTGSLYAATLRVSTLLTVGTWGAFCAAALFYYPDTWPSNYLLIVGAALAGGVVTSLAPDLPLAVAALALTVLPTATCALLRGTIQSEILGAAAFGYLIYLNVQAHQAWQTYWKVATAPTLEAMLSRQAATQSEVRFQTLFEDAPAGIYLAFRDGRVEVANHALAQMLGYTRPEALTGLNLAAFSPDYDRATVVDRAIADRAIAGRESDWLRADGSRIRVHESIRTLAGDRILGIAEDVTARFVAEQARRQLIEILEGTSDFVESIDAAGETVYLNRASRGLLGTEEFGTEESVWNRSGDENLRKQRLEIAGREGIWQGESWVPGADGEPVPVSQVIIPHRLEDGSTRSYSIVSRDISAMREAVRALKEAQEQLFQAQRLESVGRLAGGIAHDFNNLLTIVMGHASVLANRVSQPAAQESVAQIEKAAARAADLTGQLLAFGRKQVLSPGVVDICDIVRGAERMLRSVVGERISLVTKLSSEPLPAIVDASQLDHVLVNLILNARDAMPQGGVATIEATAIGEATAIDAAIRISVSDTGTGMDEATLARVFEPFFTTKGPGRGTGLGLATAYGFITQSGGTLSVASNPGEGTTFVILLPRCAVIPPAASLATTEPAAEANTERILVVDDEPALRELLGQTLASDGYRVVEARDGHDALALATDSAEPFDLIVTDVIMPGMTGPQLASKLRAMFPDLEILLISGYPGDGKSELTIAGPAAGYLPKPFTADALLQQVRRQLDRRDENQRSSIT